jgi:hypothetical protein
MTLLGDSVAVETDARSVVILCIKYDLTDYLILPSLSTCNARVFEFVWKAAASERLTEVSAIQATRRCSLPLSSYRDLEDTVLCGSLGCETRFSQLALFLSHSGFPANSQCPSIAIVLLVLGHPSFPLAVRWDPASAVRADEAELGRLCSQRCR